MSLKAQITSDIKDAMKAKEAVKLATLRFLNSAIKNKEIEVRPKELTEDDVLSVIKKAAKQRKESIDQYEKAGRQDLADNEAAELAVLEGYLPELLGREQLEPIVVEIMEAVGASSMKDMGKVMKGVMDRCGSAADNKMISEIVKSKLN